jgi:hypothetical protein
MYHCTWLICWDGVSVTFCPTDLELQSSWLLWAFLVFLRQAEARKEFFPIVNKSLWWLDLSYHGNSHSKSIRNTRLTYRMCTEYPQVTKEDVFCFFYSSEPTTIFCVTYIIKAQELHRSTFRSHPIHKPILVISSKSPFVFRLSTMSVVKIPDIWK